LNEGFIPGSTPTTTLSNTFASIVSGYGYLNIFGRGTPTNRTVKIWENLIVPGNIYAKNYYICSGDGTNCNQFTGGSSHWVKNGEGDIITPYKVGISGANPSSGLDLAIGDPNVGIRVSTTTGLMSIYNGISRLTISSTGVISVPESKPIILGAGTLTGLPTTLEIKGVGVTGSRKVTILDKVFTNEICTISGVCNSVSEIISGVDKIVAGPGVTVSPADGKGTVTISSTGSTGSSLWTANGANIYNSNTSGNVGIGVTNPGAKLDVGGAGYFSGGLVSAGGINIMNSKTLKLGDETGDQGKIGMKTFAPNNSLDIVGFGSLGNRMIKLWDSVTIPGSICDGAGSCSLVKNILEGSGFWAKSRGTNNISTASNVGVSGASPSASGLNIAVFDNVGLKYDSTTKELQLFNEKPRIIIGGTGDITIPSTKRLCLGADCRTSWPTGGVTSVTAADSSVLVTPTTGAVTIKANPANNVWTKVPSQSEAYYTGHIGVGGATDPAVGVYIAVGSNDAGLNWDGNLNLVTSNTKRVTIDPSGNTTFAKVATFNGGIKMMTNSYVATDRFLKFGDQTETVGLIGMESFSGNGSDILDIVGGGVATPARNTRVVRIWDKLKVNELCSPDAGTCSTVSRIIDVINNPVESGFIRCHFWPGDPDVVTVTPAGSPSCSSSGINGADQTTMRCPSGYEALAGGVSCGGGNRIEASVINGDNGWFVNCNNNIDYSNLTCVKR
jgi:hypothetical protein